ncbi:MAG: agmatinase [Candidatus Kariarchaeaceae archaeon]
MNYEDDGYGSFGGLVYEEIALEEVDVIIQSIPYENATSGNKGTSLAAQEIRAVSKNMQTISRRGVDFNSLIVKDVGNIPIYPLDAAKTRESIEKNFKELLSKSNAKIITIGGDHSISYPLIKTLSNHVKIGIICFDAHRDLLDNYLGSKYSHGSPLLRSLELETINPEDMVFIGTRYMDQEEQKVVDKYKLNEFRMVDLEEKEKVDLEIQLKIKEIAERVDYFYVSVDIDVLDPAFAPGTGTQVGGGLTTSQLMTMLWNIPAPIKAFDLVEVSPPLDQSGITVKASLGIISEMLAKFYSQKER